MLGLLAGFLYGQWATCIGLAVFFEMLWLDLFPAGTYIPPHRTLTAFSILVLSCEMQIDSPATLLPLIAIGLIMARVGAWLESRQRSWQNASYDCLHQRISEGCFELPLGRIVLGSMVQMTAMNAALFSLVIIAGTALLQAQFFTDFPISRGIEWPHLWAMALVGGVLALRIRRAYEMFIAGMLICFLILLW